MSSFLSKRHLLSICCCQSTCILDSQHYSDIVRPLIKYKILHVIMVMSEIILNLDFLFTEIFSTWQRRTLVQNVPSIFLEPSQDRGETFA